MQSPSDKVAIKIFAFLDSESMEKEVNKFLETLYGQHIVDIKFTTDDYFNVIVIYKKF